MRGTPAKMRIQPLWARVERNRLKLALFIAGFLAAAAVAAEVAAFLPVTLLVGLVWGRMTLGSLDPASSYPSYLHVSWFWDNLHVVAAGIALVGVVTAAAYVAYVLTRPLQRQLEGLGAVFVPLGDLMPTKHALKEMAIAAGVDPAPKLYVLDTSSVNAFIIARGKQRPICVVTRGLAEKLEPALQRAVFANLVARLRAGDIAWATAVSAFMAPVWKWRDASLQADRHEGDRAVASFLAGDGEGATYVSTPSAGSLGGDRSGVALVAVWALVAYAFAVFVSELVALGHRRSHLLSAETADAEGMLLLKDPQLMLRALDRVIRSDNRVRLALPLYAQLFYIWAGDDQVDEHDPEWRRLARLREVLGVWGMADFDAEAERASLLAAAESAHQPPPAPRVEG